MNALVSQGTVTCAILRESRERGLNRVPSPQNSDGEPAEGLYRPYPHISGILCRSGTTPLRTPGRFTPLSGATPKYNTNHGDYCNPQFGGQTGATAGACSRQIGLTPHLPTLVLGSPYGPFAYNLCYHRYGDYCYIIIPVCRHRDHREIPSCPRSPC